ncbi:hypothetical protein COCC4DRAFT_51704 [Bipolaris maydis ATCC 48331]|uniref:Uncharacterized protein n=1 Tax=Cochliobolus heterostrophus (strain C4 / ATCC 48331 / race T) TaxID=665024 RepID=N4WRU9_COCH4|nr:uncharacterized protein COCC4DRAFT_51704 [Bipolaris maydis ATCC 48331]ENI03249.1 hypothetical protein COCC4DRAFT_51704 [Bipolaris maydis ATCC 48331]KAJ5024040.1 hypothetical protein J3E73DRAFT_235948 [Bipolaris maydis]KAJ6268739.1 hypothetical protein PSV08DRAFT_207613 [Bipolaris maydis]KAJ6278984.1 hypothetical protein J3E71DRAFT_355954 [Bipolaris maydis]
MNFVDVQPKSFLDYAWTSPSPAAVTATNKPSKTSRKQNRCCDQCRKGKRACDAAILEDTLLETSRTGASPTVFHYSDVYGPLASCGNCEKTKKTCTFEWLRSQRVSQASQPQVTNAPSPKRRRTRSDSGSKSHKGNESYPSTTTTRQTELQIQPHEQPLLNITPPELGFTFGDFPCGAASFAIDPTPNFMEEPFLKGEMDDAEPLIDYVGALSEEHYVSDKPDDSPRTDYEANSTTDVKSASTNESLVRVDRKRRRRSSSASVSYSAPPYPVISYADKILLSGNNMHLSEKLLKIYHNSFENALACWVTERTCPYSARTNSLLATNARPDWTSIYHRVIRLDRLASTIRGRKLTQGEDQAASRALDLAVLSFASQWAQSGQKSRIRYPFHSTAVNGNCGVFDSQGEDHEIVGFDRTLQMTAWQDARNALQKAGEIESFRVVLAQIIFALTQRPSETNDVSTKGLDTAMTHEVLNSQNSTEHIQGASTTAVDPDMDECSDLMSKLDLAIDADGPPVHLESGLRLIHSLRSRMAVSRQQRRTKPGSKQFGEQRRSPAMLLEEADRATVDLLFWLGVTFDTLSAAMHKRPLVVSDEDSDVVLNESMQSNDSAYPETKPSTKAVGDGLWDGYLFARQQHPEHTPTRWPCSFDQAATALCDAAPVKVLLFRRVCRIQTLLTRNARGVAVEEAVHAALDVCNHWNALYAPFIRDCIQHHDSLPPRVQSWYVCVAGHWLLATLLLADLMEVVDESELGLKETTEHRDLTGFIARFRENNCRILSDLASCACPSSDMPFPSSREFHFTINEGALLTDPWTAVLIRAFAKAGVLLLESETLLPSDMDQEDAFRRADDCIKALWFLGRKSDMALAAARILGDALKQRRKSAQDRISDMSTFLESQLWHDLDGLNEAFDVECDP